MNRTIVGMYRGEAPEMLRERLPEGASGGQLADGPLALAWTGSGEAVMAGPGRAGCVVDGHIYNRDELVREQGLDPDATPDGVVAALYDRIGEEAFTQMRGDFVAVVWELGGRRVRIARDQLGGRALVYSLMDGRLAFASEVRELLALLPRRPGPDHASLSHWLVRSSPPRDRTFYDGVRRLRGGYVMRMGVGGLDIGRFWAPEPKPTRRISRADAAEELRAAVSRAVERRARPEETTAIMLSGGLDSSTVAAVARRRLPPERAPRAGYSAVFPHHRSVDESELIGRLTSELGLRSVRIAVEEGSVLGGALEYLQHWELPPVSPNLFFWLPLLRRAADDGVNALLDGEGGDEIFNFSPFLIADRMARLRMISAVRLARGYPGTGYGEPLSRLLRRLAAYGVRPLVPPRLRRARQRLRGDRVPADRRRPLLEPEWERAYLETDEQWDWQDEPGPRWSAFYRRPFTWSASWGYGLDHIRRRAVMAGLEARHPLGDVDLIELVLALPPEYAFDRDYSRPLIRSAMEGILPDEVRLRRNKSLFDEIFQQSLAAHDLDAVRSVVFADDAEVRAYVNMEEQRKRLAEPPPPGEDRAAWAVDLWRLVTAELWLRAQSDTSYARDSLERLALKPPRYELLA